VHHWAGYPKRKVKKKVDTHMIKHNLTWDDIHKCFSKKEKFGTASNRC
jgi:hypothetical protein